MLYKSNTIKTQQFITKFSSFYLPRNGSWLQALTFLCPLDQRPLRKMNWHDRILFLTFHYFLSGVCHFIGFYGIPNSCLHYYIFSIPVLLCFSYTQNWFQCRKVDRRRWVHFFSICPNKLLYACWRNEASHDLKYIILRRNKLAFAFLSSGTKKIFSSFPHLPFSGVMSHFRGIFLIISLHICHPFLRSEPVQFHLLLWTRFRHWKCFK